jgi:hypothetical protein
MIAQLLAELQAVEKTALAAKDLAADAYQQAAKSARTDPDLAKLATLDPGRHQIVLGAIRNAIEHAQVIMNATEPKPSS